MNEPANFGTNLDKPWNWPEGKEPVWSLVCPENNRYEDPPYRTSMLSTPQPLYNKARNNTVLNITRISAGPQMVIRDRFS